MSPRPRICLTLRCDLFEATNIIGSVFYGVPLAIFLIAFFLKPIGGTAVFWGSSHNSDPDHPVLFHFEYRLPLVQLDRVCHLHRFEFDLSAFYRKQRADEILERQLECDVMPNNKRTHQA